MVLRFESLVTIYNRLVKFLAGNILPQYCWISMHLHPYENRRLSVREALRIQGVDDSYVLSTKGQLSKKFKMIGNGVPVPLAAAVAKTLRDFIDKLKLNKD